jgi:hypothetical protein
MSSSTLHQDNRLLQYTQDGIFTMQGYALNKLINNLIREHAEYRHAECSLDVRILPLSDKRLLLSYFADSGELEHANESATATEVLFGEHVPDIQKLVDYECYEVYNEYTEEMRAYK